MKRAAMLALAAGLLLACALVVWSGPTVVAGAVAAGGFMALAAMTAAHLPSLWLCSVAWQRLYTDRRGWLFTWARFVRDAVGGVVVVPVSGELAGVRVLALHGVETLQASAGTVVDVTGEMLAQVAFTVLGIALFAAHAGSAYHAWTAVAGTMVAALCLAAFVGMQRRGLPGQLRHLPERLARSWGWPLAQGYNGLGAAMRAIYARRRAFALCVMVHFVAWVAGVLEVWVGLHMLGKPFSFLDAVALESQVYAVRAAAFLVPAGLGVQEGTYLLLGGLLGLRPGTALAIALLKRGREIVIGLPGLLAWQMLEGRRLLRRRAPSGARRRAESRPR